MSPKTRILLIVVIVAGALAGRYYYNPDTDAVRGSGAPIVQVVVPELSAIAIEGRQLFDQNCASCHGSNAAGQEGVGPPLITAIYKTRFHGDIAFNMAVNNGSRAHHWKYGNMPIIEGVSDDDVAKIVTYVRELQVANGIK